MSEASDTRQIFGGNLPERELWPAMKHGAMLRCPKCGEGRLFRAYLKTVDHCEACGEAMHHHRADDAPPYVTIVIIGHIIVAAVLAVEVAYSPPIWVHLALWLPLTLITCMASLPPIKGALVGLQWAFYMHGFHPNGPDDPEIGEAWPPEGRKG